MLLTFDLLDPIFSIMNNKAVPWLLSGGILVFAFVMYLVFSAKLQKIIEEIASARTSIAQFKEGRIDFAALSTFMLNSTSLKAPWQALERSLIIEVDELDGPNRIVAPHNIGDYFNDQSILGSSINLRFYQGLPNILVGLGLFFTFVGLVMALWFASKGVAAKEVEEAQAALKNLLDAATFKFLTSLAGLSSSLLFSYMEKARLHQIAGQIELLAVELEATLKRRSLEQMAHQRNLVMERQQAVFMEQLEEARQQTAQIKRFETDFAVSIASALDNRLSSRFEYLAATLSVAIENLGLKIGSVNEEALQTMIGDFRKTLTEGTSSEIAKMADLVAQLTSRLESSGDNLEVKLTSAGNEISDTFKVIAQDLMTSGDGFKGILQGAGQEMTHTFTAISENLMLSGQQLSSSLQKAGEDITGSAKVLDGVLINLKADLVDLENVVKQATDSAEKTTTLLSRNVTDLSELHVSLGGTLQGLQGVGQTIENTSQALSLAVNTMTKSQQVSIDQSRQLLETARVALGSIQASGESVASVTKSLQGAWESYQSRFERVDDDLERVFSQVQMGLEHYSDKVKEFQSSLDKHLATALQSLGAVVQELSDSVEELNQAK